MVLSISRSSGGRDGGNVRAAWDRNGIQSDCPRGECKLTKNYGLMVINSDFFVIHNGFPLVNVYISMENHHCLWGNQLDNGLIVFFAINSDYPLVSYVINHPWLPIYGDFRDGLLLF